MAIRQALVIAGVFSSVFALRRKQRKVSAVPAEADGTPATLLEVDDTAVCVGTLMSQGASPDGASACCDLGAAYAALLGRPGMEGMIPMMAAKAYQDGSCGGQPGQTSEVVRALNRQYAGFDPADSTSSLGVAVHIVDSESKFMNETWNMACEKNCMTSVYTGGVCSIAISILNRAVSKIEDHWTGKEFQPMSKVCTYPGTTRGGVVYTNEAVVAATRCSYAVDAYSTMRPNFGCGCLQDRFKCIKWPNGTVSGYWEETDDMITPCECNSIDEDPTLDNSVGDAKCYWQGERMQEGAGQSGIRKAIQQQYKFRETSKKCWNELLLDATVTNDLMRKDAASTISAYVVPYPMCAFDKGCRDEVVATRNFVQQEFGLASPIPIVGLNLQNPDEPFVVLDAAFS